MGQKLFALMGHPSSPPCLVGFVLFTKVVTRNCKSRKDRQCNGQKKNDEQRSTKHYTVSLRLNNTNPTRQGGELGCPMRANSFCSMIYSFWLQLWYLQTCLCWFSLRLGMERDITLEDISCWNLRDLTPEDISCWNLRDVELCPLDFSIIRLRKLCPFDFSIICLRELCPLYFSIKCFRE
jgi:hypothetical protein